MKKFQIYLVYKEQHSSIFEEGDIVLKKINDPFDSENQAEDYIESILLQNIDTCKNNYIILPICSNHF